MEILKKFSEGLAKAAQACCDAVALGEYDISLSAAIERDAEGIPLAWRIFKYGGNELFKNGQRLELDFSEEVFDAIIAHFQSTGNKIPLDSNHFLYRLAEEYNVSEQDILDVLPDGYGTFAFAGLEKRADGLWISNVEYLPLARKLMKEGAFRYFSPVIRGLSDGRFRVTSVTMENVPAMTNLQSLAAAAEDRDINDITRKLDAIAASAENKSTKARKKEMSMKKLLIAIAGLLGMDNLSLGAEEDAPEGVIEKINAMKAEAETLRAFAAGVKESLALGAEADNKAAIGALKGVLAKSESADTLKTRVDALELAAETALKDRLIEQGLADGKLSPAQVEGWVKHLDTIALSAYLEHAPVNKAVATKVPRFALGEQQDGAALSAEDKEVCKRLGIPEQDMLETKKKSR